jgi:hypothetical protein
MLLFSLCSIVPAAAQVSIGIGLPGVSIGINLPVYPQLVRVPGYPVYYAPQMDSNYFFYDGMYWVYDQDNWYASTWYNGPWELVGPETVPLFILRIPVRYYRHAPSYFHGWSSDAPPHWGEHWGNAWEDRRRGWDSWNRNSVPQPAPLPVYQRQYSGDKYPPVEQQQVLQSRNYRYKPQDTLVRQHYPAPQAQSAPATSPPQGVPPPGSRQGTAQRQQQAPQAHAQDKAVQAKRPAQEPKAQQQTQQTQQGTAQRQQQAPQAHAQDKAVQAKRPAQEPKAQQQTQQTRQATPQHQQQAPQAQAQEKGQQGKASAQEPKQGQGKGPAKGEQRDGEGGK